MIITFPLRVTITTNTTYQNNFFPCLPSHHVLPFIPPHPPQPTVHVLFVIMSLHPFYTDILKAEREGRTKCGYSHFRNYLSLIFSTLLFLLPSQGIRLSFNKCFFFSLVRAFIIKIEFQFFCTSTSLNSIFYFSGSMP